MVLLVLLLLPILEIGAAILVAQAIGLLPTLLLLVGLSVLGVVLIRAEGPQTWRRANAELAAGRAPTDTLLDGLMVLVGGVLLIVPGFLTAVPGLLLLFPPTRALLRPVQRATPRGCTDTPPAGDNACPAPRTRPPSTSASPWTKAPSAACRSWWC